MTDLLDALFGSLLALLRVAAGAEARRPELQEQETVFAVKHLAVGVAQDELDVFDTLLGHVPDGIAATPANAYDLDEIRRRRLVSGDDEFGRKPRLSVCFI